jgi:hypothetical protein
MSVERLDEELGKITPVVSEGKVRMWVTPRAESIIRASTPGELLSVMIDAYAKTAREIGRQSEPFSMGHHETPDLLFVGTRLRPREPYYFVVQAVADDANWLRLMTDAYNASNKH